jgi:hypothetical protein
MTCRARVCPWSCCGAGTEVTRRGWIASADGSVVVVAVVAEASEAWFCRFRVEVVYRSGRFVSLELPFHIVPLLLPSGVDGEVLAVARDRAVLSTLIGKSNDLGTSSGSFSFRRSPMCMYGPYEQIDGSSPVWQLEICCPMVQLVMQCDDILRWMNELRCYRCLGACKCTICS